MSKAAGAPEESGVEGQTDTGGEADGSEAEERTAPSGAAVDWKEEFRFRGRAPDGRETVIDGDSREGPSPVTLLLESIASCAACDVVEILRKGRQELRGLTVEIEGDRRSEPPRHLLNLRLVFRIEGEVERSRAERAVELSLEKYCSVFHTLRQDLEVESKIILD